MLKSYKTIKKESDRALLIIEDLIVLKQRKAILLKDIIELKRSLLEDDGMSIKHGGDDNPKSDFSKSKILIKVNELLSELKENHKILNDLLKGDECKELNKLQNHIEKCTNKINKKIGNTIKSSFLFLNGVSKKMINSGIIDKCVVKSLNIKEKKVISYKNCISRYEQLINEVANRYADYEQKLIDH